MKGKIGLVYPSGHSEEIIIGSSLKGKSLYGERPCRYYIVLDEKEEQHIHIADAKLFNRWMMNDVCKCISNRGVLNE